MTSRIDTAARGRFAVFILSGRIEKQAIAEWSRLFELQANCCDIVLDLQYVSLVDRIVMRFFVRCEADWNFALEPGLRRTNVPAAPTFTTP
jgi:hypothetical protein